MKSIKFNSHYSQANFRSIELPKRFLFIALFTILCQLQTKFVDSKKSLKNRCEQMIQRMSKIISRAFKSFNIRGIILQIWKAILKKSFPTSLINTDILLVHCLFTIAPEKKFIIPLSMVYFDYCPGPTGIFGLTREFKWGLIWLPFQKIYYGACLRVCVFAYLRICVPTYPG